MRQLTNIAGVLPGWDAVAHLDIAGVTADSRTVGPGDLFAALPGARSDGRAFIAEAVERGAVAVLASPGTAWPQGVPQRPIIFDAEPRSCLARIAAVLAGPQPETIVAVTGTNGKTSTVEFIRQLWSSAGTNAASLGTLGLIAPGFGSGTRSSEVGSTLDVDRAPDPENSERGGVSLRLSRSSAGLTTPDPVSLAETLAGLARHGVTKAAMEASSHGLDQFRLDGVRLAGAAFTNLTRDHLDYHGTLDDYRRAKLRLFETLLPDGAAAVAHADMDADTLTALREIALRRHLDLRTVGENGSTLRLVEARPHAGGQDLTVMADGRVRQLVVNLPGRFQADNVLVAAAMTEALGLTDALDRLPMLRGVRGRMERVACLPNGAVAYVDYAHTPDALERLLTALRPHTTGRLHVVFGAGGDRDRGKRPLMGQAASRLADAIIVTDDNPRGEDAALIRSAILAACPAAREIGDRAKAIETALNDLAGGDVLVVAGKGHEQGQIVGAAVLPFDDASVIRHLAGCEGLRG